MEYLMDDDDSDQSRLLNVLGTAVLPAHHTQVYGW